MSFVSRNVTVGGLSSQAQSEGLQPVELYLRDSLIKAFVLIFTNQNSQHMLMHSDLIDIAFNCLQRCKNITLEALKNLATLISQILCIPKVHRRLLSSKNYMVLVGMCDLLEELSSYEEKTAKYLNLCLSQRERAEKDLDYAEVSSHSLSSESKSALEIMREKEDLEMKKQHRLFMKMTIVKNAIASIYLLSSNSKLSMYPDVTESMLKSLLKLLECAAVLFLTS